MKKHNPKIENRYNAKYWIDLDKMISNGYNFNTLSIYRETFHLLSKNRIRLLKKNCVVINTSRGEIIDEQALADSLFKKKIGGAGLDVFEHEPQITQKLFDCENVVLLPHISSATKESRIAMGDRVLKNIDSYLRGKSPPDLIKIKKTN